HPQLVRGVRRGRASRADPGIRDPDPARRARLHLAILMQPTRMEGFEYFAELDRNLFPPGQALVRVRYRPLGERRWRKFALLDVQRKTLDEVERMIEPAIRAHHERSQ